jgi:hypothetical protein
MRHSHIVLFRGRHYSSSHQNVEYAKNNPLRGSLLASNSKEFANNLEIKNL